MGKKYKFSIGEWVQFKKYYKVSSCNGERYAYEIGLRKPIIGQISGAVIRYIGKIKNEDWDYHKEHGILVSKKPIILYQIKTGMINVPHEVKEEDIDSYFPFTDIPPKLPWKKGYYDKSLRNLMADYAADRVRNEKGHFL